MSLFKKHERWTVTPMPMLATNAGNSDGSVITSDSSGIMGVQQDIGQTELAASTFPVKLSKPMIGTCNPWGTQAASLGDYASKNRGYDLPQTTAKDSSPGMLQ